MLFSSDSNGLRTYFNSSNTDFITPEFLNTLIWMLPMSAFVVALGLILWSKIMEKAKNKVGE